MAEKAVSHIRRAWGNDSSVPLSTPRMITYLNHRVGLTGSEIINGTEMDDLVGTDRSSASDHPAASEIISLIGVTFAVVSIILNLIFLCSRCFIRLKKTAYNQFMTNLSVSDIMTSLSFLVIQYWPRGPFANIDLNPDFYVVPALPYVFRSLPWLFFTSYLLTLNCLTINQWIAVCKPWKYSVSVTKVKVRVSLAVIWTVASLQVIVPLMVLVLLSCLEDIQDAKKKLWSVSKVEMQIWMAFYALSTIFNIYLNVIVYRKISKLKRKRRGVHGSNSGLSNIRMKQRAFVTVSMLLVACCFFRIPFPIFGIIGVAFVHSMSTNIYYICNAGVIFLLHLNCLIDPIIYISRTRDVKKSMKVLLGKIISLPCCYSSWRTKQMSLNSLRSEAITFQKSEFSKRDSNYSMMITAV